LTVWNDVMDAVSKYNDTFFTLTFVLYCLGFMLFVIAVTGKKWGGTNPETHMKRWGKIAFVTTLLGFACHLLFFFTRWYMAGHIPTSNMFEFMTFLAMMIIFAYIIVYLIYRTLVIGIFALPIGVIILAYAAVFPQDVQPLIPALQSYWLKIHVTTAAAGEAFFAVGFAAGLMHLLRTIDFTGTSKSSRREQRGVEFTIFFMVMIIAFVGSVFTFNGLGYKAKFVAEVKQEDKSGVEQTIQRETVYVLPPFIQPHNSKIEEMKPFLGMEKPLFEAPSWLAARKTNTVIWTLISGFLLYGLLRLIVRKPLSRAISPVLNGIDAEDLDEISYRAIVIGYPIFTLGALIFAMIWAHEAWGRFWGWDPKEVWALITWLFYAAYLHLRLSKGWMGKRSSWMSVLGFLVVMFTLIGVNLVIAGLHSYAGV